MNFLSEGSRIAALSPDFIASVRNPRPDSVFHRPASRFRDAPVINAQGHDIALSGLDTGAKDDGGDFVILFHDEGNHKESGRMRQGERGNRCSI